MPSFKGEKLRVNLRLTINRLKLLEKKKTEQALKARKEIAEYIKNGRLERARIRVEHIIREDYLVEAMEVIELYCDLLIARFGMLDQMSYCEESLAEAVSTLIWVAPRLSADIQELSVIAKQLENKFGKPFSQQARSNMSGTVNPKVIHRLGAEAPKKSLVENYMIEIARNYKIEYEPDTTMFLDDEAVSFDPTDEKPFFPGSDGPSGGGGVEQQPNPYAPDPVVPPQQPYLPMPHHQQPNQAPGGPLPSKLPPQDFVNPPGPPPPSSHMAPPYSEHPPPPSEPHLPYPTPGGHAGGQQPPPLPNSSGLDLPPVPTSGFPDTTSSTSDSVGGDVDFDDLTKRFEQLKKKR